MGGPGLIRRRGFINRCRSSLKERLQTLTGSSTALLYLWILLHLCLPLGTSFTLAHARPPPPLVTSLPNCLPRSHWACSVPHQCEPVPCDESILPPICISISIHLYIHIYMYMCSYICISYCSASLVEPCYKCLWSPI